MPKSKMSHGLLGRLAQHSGLLSVASIRKGNDSTRRDRADRWLWRFVRRFCPTAHRDQSPPQRQRGGSPFFQQMSSSASVITDTNAMNSAGRAFPRRKTSPSANSAKYATSTNQPCQHVGKPQPHPNRFAGNQYLSRGVLMGTPSFCLTSKRSHDGSWRAACLIRKLIRTLHLEIL